MPIRKNKFGDKKQVKSPISKDFSLSNNGLVLGAVVLEGETRFCRAVNLELGLELELEWELELGLALEFEIGCYRKPGTGWFTFVLWECTRLLWELS